MKTTHAAILALFAASGLAGAFSRKPHADPRATEIARSFEKFSPQVKTRSDEKSFYVESNGMPDHPLMVGITAWQQQVPIPQDYTGGNAWSFPLHPVPTDKPLSAKDHFFRGAIAIAADGVPIFNPIKNDGRTDTFLAGELDRFGGHSGRGDDYHYHISPTFLQDKIGKQLPIAFALDGYPIYGYAEPNGTVPKDLDSFNGHTTEKLGYHYHATKAYPYLNGGFHGVVTEIDGQVDPQPRASSPRPATDPLRGAKITGFEETKKGSAYSLTYELGGETYHVNYSIEADGGARFEYVKPDGSTQSERYGGQQKRRRRGEEPQGRAEGALGPPPGPRKPWLSDHMKELDSNNDQVLTQAEVTEAAKDAFRQYADGKKSVKAEDLPNLPTARGAVGGFVKVHVKEIDADQDGSITEQEVIQSLLRMFDKQDRDHDGKLQGKELEGRTT